MFVRFPALLPVLLIACAPAALAGDVPPRVHSDPGYEARITRQRSLVPGLRHRLASPVPLRLEEVSREEILKVIAGAAMRSPLAGIHRPIEASNLSAGRWESLPDGRLLWRLAIESPGARALRVHVSDLPEGRGRLWVHDGEPDGAQVSGPYEYGDFWTDVVMGGRLVIEFEPSDPGLTSDLPFRLDKVAHIFAGLLPGSPAIDLEFTRRAGPLALGEAVDRLLEGSRAPTPREAAGSCHLDVACYDDWALTARSVGWMVFETSEGTSVCSGTLLNTSNSSNRPYFITANHCISDAAGARSLQVFWSYEASSCNASTPDPRSLPRSRGSAYLGGKSYQQGDSSLILLDQLPDGVVFSGWTLDNPADGSAVIGVSHPSGSPKKISFGRVGPRARDSGVPARDEDYYGVSYSNQGLVEPGSSGSGLFLRPGVLAGMLSHGRKPTDRSQEAYCNFLPFSVNYGRLNVSYSLFRDLLEDRATTAPPPAESTNAQPLRAGEAAALSLAPVSSPTMFSGSSAYQIEVTPGTVRLDVRMNLTEAGADAVLYVRRGSAPAIVNGQVQADYIADSPGGAKTVSVTATSNPPLSPGVYYIAIGIRSTGIALSGSLVATLSGASTPSPPSGTRNLSPGQPVSFSLGPVDSAQLYAGSGGYTINVPQNATRLEIRLTTPTPGVDVDLYARFGQDVAISGGSVLADHRSEGSGGDETIAITASSTPALRAGVYYVAFGLFTRGVRANCSLVASISTGGAPPPSARALSSGQPAGFVLGPVNTGTLHMGEFGYTIAVPQGATRLEVRLSTATTGVDVDLYARYERDVILENGRVAADHYSENSGGQESVIVTTASNPPLRPGTYFIGFGLFTRGVTANCSVTATVTGASGPPSAATALTSGQPASFSIGPVRSPFLYNDSAGYTIAVPEGATRLEVRLRTTTPAADIDLFARRGSDVTLNASQDGVVADFRSEGPTGEELIIISTDSNPALSAGTYYIALALFTANVTAQGTVTATVSTPTAPPPSDSGLLVSGEPRAFAIAPVTRPLLLNGPAGFRIQVPQNATRLEVRLSSPAPNVDIDLFARYGADPVISNQAVVADHSSESSSAEEYILVTASSSPPLRPGTYYIATAMFTANTAATATITATVSTGSSSPAGGSTLLSSALPLDYSIGPVDGPSLFNGPRGFQVAVPEGASRLEIQLRTPAAGVDVDLYARAGQDVVFTNGAIVADSFAEGPDGNETLVISGASLNAGTYYIALGVYSTGVTVTGTLTATVTTAAAPPGTGPTVLTSGTPAPFRIGPVSNPTLFYERRGFAVDVPAGATRLDLRLSTTTRDADVDLHARFDQDAAIADGRIVSDYASDGPTGAESISITAASEPPLQAGRYYVSLALYTVDAEVTGDLTATVSLGAAPAPRPSAATVLSPAAPAKFSLPAVEEATLFSGDYSFVVTVPEAVSRLTIHLASDSPDVDTDLFVRYGEDVDVVEGTVVADYRAATDSGNEQIVITPASSPALTAGVYYISIGVFTTGAPSTGSITASIERAAVAPPISSAVILESGVETPFTLPAVPQPTLFAGAYGFRVVVPPEAGSLHISARTAGDEDIDLAVRFGQDLNQVEGSIVADHTSASAGGAEELTITAASSPPLRPGVYFIALPLYTAGVPVSGTITATVSGASLARAAGLRKTCAAPGCDSASWLLPKTGVAVAEPLGASKFSAGASRLAVKPGSLKKRTGIRLVK